MFELRIASVSILLLGVTLGPTALPVFSQTSTNRSTVARPTLNGGSRVLSETVTETTDVEASGTRVSTRREYGTDADGRSTLIQSVEEHRITTADGDESIVREFTQPDVNGRSRAMRRETQETVSEGNGAYRTEIEISIPGPSGDRLVPTERVEQTEQRDGDRTLESERVTYTNVTNRGEWKAREQRVVTHSHGDADVQSVESVYRPDGSGSMVLRDQIVRKEWTGSRGQQHSREEVFATEIPGQGRTSKPRLFQQIDTVRTTRSDGGSQATREVSERRGGRTVVVERTTERERPDGRGGTIVERETQRRDVNGRLRTVRVSREAGSP